MRPISQELPVNPLDTVSPLEIGCFFSGGYGCSFDVVQSADIDVRYVALSVSQKWPRFFLSSAL